MIDDRILVGMPEHRREIEQLTRQRDAAYAAGYRAGQERMRERCFWFFGVGLSRQLLDQVSIEDPRQEKV